MTHQLPIIKAEPVQTVDFMRGLALLMINLQTNPLFAFPKPQPVCAQPGEGAASDMPTQFFLHLLVQGSCYGLFSVGFGWSFYRSWQGLQPLGLDADRIARRGLWALLALGLLQGLVCGAGDMLHQYALLSFSLIYFSQQSRSTLFKWIVGLAAIGIFIQIIGFLIVPFFPPSFVASGRPLDAALSPLVKIWPTSSFEEVLHYLSAGIFRPLIQAIGQSLAPYVQDEILLLVGLLVGKLGQLDRPIELRLRLSLLLLFIFPLAILLKAVSSLAVVELSLLPTSGQGYEPLLVALGEFLGTPLLTLVYVLELGLNVNQISASMAVWMSQVGRMSLTNYLLQSGLCRLLFDEHGLGLSNKLSGLELVGMILIIYSFQLWVSHWWLSRYRQGPVEQLLNWWTYRKRVAKPFAPVRDG